MNSTHVAMLQPFISSLQLLIVPLMMLNIVRNDDLVYAGGSLYVIVTSDILPDLVLIPVRDILFGPLNWNDENVPEYYEILGFESRNFIACTGSVQIFLTVIILVAILNELVFASC